MSLLQPGSAPLLSDPVEAAYQIGLMEPPYCQFATWVGWPAQRPEALVIFYEIGPPAIAFCLGRAEGTRAIFDSAGELPPQLYVVCPPEHVSHLERWYEFGGLAVMQRMALPAWAYVPSPEEHVQRLCVDDLPEILALLQPESMRLDAVQLRRGWYFGVRRHGELVSMAAAHFVSPTRSVALIGNIVTRPDQRNQGLARAAVLRLLGELRAVVASICLDVNVSNGGAVKLYETLGFAPRSRHVEGRGRRRS